MYVETLPIQFPSSVDPLASVIGLRIHLEQGIREGPVIECKQKRSSYIYRT